MANPVLSKREFVRRYLQGEFGNTAPEWATLDSLLSSEYRGLVHVRNRTAGGPTWYDIPASIVDQFVQGIVYKGLADLSQLYFAAMGPGDDKRVLQGEVMNGVWGLDLLWTTVKKPMRSALIEQSYRSTGIIAKLILDQFLCQRSLDWLEYLLATYEDHIVEFTAWSVSWGTVPGYNTTFWEVRKY